MFLETGSLVKSTGYKYFTFLKSSIMNLRIQLPSRLSVSLLWRITCAILQRPCSLCRHIEEWVSQTYSILVKEFSCYCMQCGIVVGFLTGADLSRAVHYSAQPLVFNLLMQNWRNRPYVSSFVDDVTGTKESAQVSEHDWWDGETGMHIT